MKLVTDGVVITNDSEDKVIKEGAVLIEGDSIKEVGKADELRQNYPEAEIIDAGGQLIMPGFINSHLHFYSTFARGMDLKAEKPPREFTEILEKLWWRLDRTLSTRDDLYYSAVYALLEGIKRGTTTVFDHHASYGLIDGSLDILKQAVEDVGLRASLCFEVSDRNGEEKREKALRENERFLNSLVEEEKSYLSGAVGLHASFTLEEETLGKAGELAEKYNAPCHLHVAEGRADVEDARKRGFEGIVERLDRHGIWQPGTMAVHGVHLQENEYRKLAERGCYLVHNPESNLSNGVGAADIQTVRECGLDAALGTDGYTTDMLESMTAADLLPTYLSGDPSCGGDLARWMLFDVNSRLAGETFSQPVGRLEPGAGADLVIADYSPPTPLTADNYFAHIAMGIAGGDIQTVMARGETIMKDQEVQTVDYEGIIQKCRAQARDFWERF